MTQGQDRQILWSDPHYGYFTIILTLVVGKFSGKAQKRLVSFREKEGEAELPHYIAVPPACSGI
jgi:hypothetical protein